MYFDTHAHYDFEQFDKDRDELLGQLLPAAGVSQILNVGTTVAGSAASIALANKYDYIHATVGVHPHYASKIKDGDIQRLADMTLDPKVLAIGEIGLDYHYDYSPRDVQQARFKEQLQLALKLQLPLIIHCREAEEDMYEILKKSRAGELVGGVLHCFAGNVVSAQKFLNLGWHIGIGGVVTYKNAHSLREVVAVTPHDRLLIETDCPYLTSEPYRRQRNDSSNLKHNVEKIAQIRDIAHSDAAQMSTQNAKKLFRL